MKTSLIDRMSTGLVACLLCINVFAADCDDEIESLFPAGSYSDALRGLNSQGCLRQDKQPDNQLVKAYRQQTPNVGKDSAERASNIISANKVLLDYANNNARSTVADSPLWTKVALLLSTQMRAMEAASAAEDPSTSVQAITDAISPDTWVIFEESGRMPEISSQSVFEGVDAHCADVQPDSWTECVAYENRKDLILTISLAQDLAAYSTAGRVFEHLAESKIANKKWDAYFNEARFQWWWEVWANGRAMVKRGDCDEDESTEVREGFCKVPDSQWILFHPDIALGYVSNADSSDELDGAFVVELFGKNRWNWAEDGTMQKARGWSVIAAYSDVNGSDQWGYGLMYHYRNRYSVGLTSTDGEVGLLFSIDLSDKLFERKKKYKDYLTELKKPDFWKGVFTQD